MARIFVYGSLRKGMYNYDVYLKDKSIYIGDGYVKGELYTIHGESYPALVFGESLIAGEIYEVSDEVEATIDALENYRPNDPENEYHKRYCTIYDKDKQLTGTQLATYVFNTEKASHKDVLKERIVEHDYVAYMRKQI